MALSRVLPCEPAEKHLIKLSICDAYSPKVWVTQTNFWPLETAAQAERSYDILREGLARTLAEIPALSGIISRASQDPRALVIRVEDDAHVEFTFEDLREKKEVPNYDQLKKDGFPLTGLVALFSQPITLAPVHEGARMLTAKLNHINGGIALTFGFNHLIADAATVVEVERIWSLHCSDVSAGATQRKHSQKLPTDAIRARLSKPVHGAQSFNDPNWKIFPTDRSQLNLPREAVNKEAALTVLEETKKAHLASISSEHEEMKWCMWKFSADSLAKLKAAASSADAALWISTMDALIGLFWSRLSVTKQKSHAGHDKSLMLFPINIRKRLEPEIPDGYIGNAVDIVMSTCSLSDLESENGLITAAQHVRKAVSGWSESQWASWLTMAAALPNEQAICPNPLALLDTHNMAFNDYSKSQSNTLHWGSELGVIDRSRYMKPASSLANCATAVIVHPRLADGGLEVAISITDHLRSALEADKVFGQYASFVTSFS